MNQNGAYLRDSDDVAAPVSGIELKVDRSTSDERKSRAKGTIDTVPRLRSSMSKSERGGDINAEGANSTTASQHGRKRSNSLRQAAMAKMRERIVVTPPIVASTMDSPLLDNIPTHGQIHDEEASKHSSLGEGLLNSKSAPSSPLDRHEHHAEANFASRTFSSPDGTYVSTTDEDEAMSVHYPQASSRNSFLNHFVADSAVSATRRRPHRTEPPVSLVATPSPTDPDMEDDWDHSETEWWGWVILAATWIVFVVVMGSCFGVWSWAWDVGETPYAPPDLEDDDTLPITGYYPALIVCTAVMSWVWVVVAWVGLKYFRHAKVVADDG
jgi:hypothetical protein